MTIKIFHFRALDSTSATRVMIERSNGVVFWAEKQAVNYVTAKTPGRRPDWEASGSPRASSTHVTLVRINPY
jgi:hypothetical protein